MVTLIKMAQTSFSIKEPGLNVLPPGVERYVVNGGGITGVQIFPDDEIEIINDEGNQICEIICFDKDGKSELGILNQKENGKINFIKEILERKDETSLITNLQLKKRNLDINKSKSSILFDSKSPSGEKIKISNPSDMPDSMEISSIYEPFIKIEVVLPKDYIGSIHKVGASVQNLPSCNGWDYWYIKSNKKIKLIDSIRTEYRSKKIT